MAEITIRGAGIFGLSTAWICAKRGAKVRIIDPYGPGAGASGGLVGALAPHVPENWNPKKAFQLDSLLAAESFWHNIAQAGGQDPGYARTGRLQPINDARQLELARARETTAAQLWGDHAIWQVRPASDFSDWAPPSATGYLIHDTLSARLHPRRACAALVAALASKGVQIQSDGPDQGAVLHATGAAGLATLSTALNRNIGGPVKGQAALLRFEAGATAPQLYADSLHIIPHLDGTVAIGSTSERSFDSPTETDHQLDDVITRARAALPILAGAEVLERWAGLRPRARSRAPMLGQWPERPGHFIANGGFKIGFGMAVKIAEVMAELMLEGIDRIPEGFRVEDNL